MVRSGWQPFLEYERTTHNVLIRGNGHRNCFKTCKRTQTEHLPILPKERLQVLSNRHCSCDSAFVVDTHSSCAVVVDETKVCELPRSEVVCIRGLWKDRVAAIVDR